MATQHRKQIMDAAGNWVPVPDEPQERVLTEEPPAREFKIGDAVHLTGRVLEIQSPQGGQTSVKVQLPNGAAWVRGEHLEHVEETAKPKGSKVQAEELFGRPIVFVNDPKWANAKVVIGQYPTTEELQKELAEKLNDLEEAAIVESAKELDKIHGRNQETPDLKPVEGDLEPEKDPKEEKPKEKDKEPEEKLETKALHSPPEDKQVKHSENK